MLSPNKYPYHSLNFEMKFGLPERTVVHTQVLKLDPEMQRLAESLRNESSLLVFGRGYNYATALEAALKAHCFIPFNLDANEAEEEIAIHRREQIY